MSENTKIEWCDHTFNPWVGCARVSPGCDHCYAEAWSRRAGNADLWQGARRRTSAANWRLPVKWNRRAELQHRAWQEGLALFGVDEAECIARGFIKPRRPRVFCASLADVFDNLVPGHWRWDLFRLIAATPYLDWLLLTKRIGNARAMLNSAASAALDEFVGSPVWDRAPWPNVWLGATVVNQDEADRDLPKLLETPAALRWVSYEPALGPVDFTRLYGGISMCGAYDVKVDALTGRYAPAWSGRGPCLIGSSHQCARLDWIVVGGESGGGARPFDLGWAYRTVQHCREAGTAVFIKQLGANPHAHQVYGTYSFSGQPAHFERLELHDRKGGDIAEFPIGLRVREWPEAHA